MNSAYSGKKCIKIVLIQGRNEYGLFGEEMNSVYSVKKLIVPIYGKMNIVYSGKKWIVLTKVKMNSAYSGKKWIVIIQGINE